MSKFKDSEETLRLTVEKLHKVKARFIIKNFVPEVSLGGRAWEGNVFSFQLTYDTRNNGATKEQIANWQLPGPSDAALNAAEQRGAKLRKQLLERDVRSPEIRRRAKLAYAWTSPIKGSAERQFNVVLQEGAVRSAADAVKAVMGKG